ncbi:MAG: ABC transporter ATP-binding protein [Tissierellia bacterium]|nr:ABC transporter ATP-binding protein [Tissierellia bacterium]
MNKIERKELKRKAKFRNAKLFEYGLKLKGTFIFCLILTIIFTLFEMVGPFIISEILDKQLIEGIGAKDTNNFYFLVLMYVLSMLMLTGIKYVMSLSFARLSNSLATIIQKDVFGHVLKLPIRFFDKYASGKIVSRITNDTSDIRQLFNILFSEIFPITVLIIGLMIGLFLKDYRMGLIIVAVSPISYIIYRDYKRKSTIYNRDMRRYRSDLNGNLAETIQTIEIVQAFNREDEIYEEFSKVNDKVNAEGRKMATLWAYSSFNATNTLANVVLAIIVFAFAISVLKMNPFITVGSLFIFIDYSRKIFMNINSIMNMIGEFEKSKSAADQVFELLDEKIFVDGETTLDKIEGNIEFNNVTFAYNDDEHVLKNINLSIKKNQSVAFVGHTGSGKSTIMNLIYGFYKVNMGEILIDGVNINDLNMQEIRNNMAIVFQNPYIFEGTVYENISLFDENISKNECELALILVGGEKILQRKRGIDTKVGESGAGFSSGEKQLISFARAMVRNPKILVLDEATANVDSETEEYIQFGVKQLKNGRTTLIIAHRLSTIKDVDNIYVLEKGKIIESGTHEELITKKGVYEKMYMES